MGTQLRTEAIRAYMRIWHEAREGRVALNSDLNITGPEQQVALVLLGYDTPWHREMVGISPQAIEFAARYGAMIMAESIGSLSA